MQILVTGGSGYIGSHTGLQLIETGNDAIVVDNLSNSSEKSLQRIEALTGEKPSFYKIDLLHKNAINKVFQENDIQAVIHFAGLKAVGESTEKPLLYYSNNLIATFNLCEVMNAFGCKKLIFSSSATVYGEPASVPIKEDFPLAATNPYGRSKLMIEDVLRDIFRADPTWKIALLRYFNPVGAHPSGMIGEDPNGIPNNLMPYIAQVAIGKRPHLNVFGDDYSTHDGTGIRDYIHVMDLAKGHIKTINILDKPQLLTVNLGTGRGYSVLDMVKAFEAASGKPIPYKIKHRRPGDIAECYTDPSLAYEKLGWRAEYSIDEMCIDTWRWQSKNPNGYKSINL